MSNTLNGFPVERKKLSELVKADYNPRKISEQAKKALQRSLKEFGTVEPIVFNKRSLTVVAGHQRLDALLAIGETESDIVIVDLPKNKEKALNVALNKISGEWEESKLSDLFKELQMEDFDLSLTGFELEEIQRMSDTPISFTDGLPNNLDQEQFYISFTLTKYEKDICQKAFDIAREKHGLKKPANDYHSVDILVSLCNDYAG